MVKTVAIVVNMTMEILILTVANYKDRTLQLVVRYLRVSWFNSKTR